MKKQNIYKKLRKMDNLLFESKLNKSKLKKIAKTIKEIQNEIELWKDLQKYVEKNMKGKTLTADLEKEITYILKERRTYLNNLIMEVKNEKTGKAKK